MSYYESNFYRRAFTWDGYSPAERRWSMIGTIAGCGIGGGFRRDVATFMTSTVHNSFWGHTLSFVFMFACVVAVSELARRIVRWRERSKRTIAPLTNEKEARL